MIAVLRAAAALVGAPKPDLGMRPIEPSAELAREMRRYRFDAYVLAVGCPIGFAEVGVLPLVAFALWRAHRRVPFLVFCTVALVLGTISVGFNTSAHYSWVLDNCVPRYLWMLAAALPLTFSPSPACAAAKSASRAISRSP